MEYEIKNKEGAIPCLIVADDENGRYMIREADTSGEVFNSSREMLFWIYENWEEQDFEDKQLFHQIVSSLQDHVRQSKS
ncbi:hypothetical protein [Metabacillus endolithicus]|uniref:Threonine dehydratase n=1 Tax=Metabacillus endolithicus TaxID=1535204 RepID=A0ABW5BXL3_9BACI|nr:hypothetical protein [Metabacillus endolithicus]UPG64223.1 hypothetical protein MVE64_03580 [Metabacillus endolithicus]